MKIVCIIPARLASRRFPQKVLSRLGDKPLLQWVWEAALSVKQFDVVAFAIDAVETARLIDSFGGRYYLTSPTLPSGTDRLIELRRTQALSGDIWVNWQGDEPFIYAEMIDTLLQKIEPDVSIWSLKKRIEKKEEVDNPNIVKVVTNSVGRALYFSRAPIPYNRELSQEIPYYKHIGMYAFTDQALHTLSALPPSPLEKIEKLEPLRFLEHGLNIHLHETIHETIGIDVPEDLERASSHHFLRSGVK